MPENAAGLTIRTKADLRLWETVTDRTAALSWPWEPTADEARLVFSNRLTHAVSSVAVARKPGTMRGGCAHPASSGAAEGLVAATLLQLADGVEIARETAELAYVPGASGRAITVQAKAVRNWYRVERPRLAAFDARWWGLAGPSGYEVLWSKTPGWHRVEKSFGGRVVDGVDLLFMRPGVLLFVR